MTVVLALWALPVPSRANSPTPSTVIKSTGTYSHASGLEFPEKVGSLERTEILAFPEARDDVGVTYRSGGDHPVVLTVFAYPVLDADFDAHFEQVVNDVREAHKAEPQQKATTSSDTPKGTLHTGLATFLFAEPFFGGKQPEAPPCTVPPTSLKRPAAEARGAACEERAASILGVAGQVRVQRRAQRGQCRAARESIAGGVWSRASAGGPRAGVSPRASSSCGDEGALGRSAAATEGQWRREATAREDDVVAAASEPLGSGTEGGEEREVGGAQLEACTLAGGVHENGGRAIELGRMMVGILAQDAGDAERLAAFGAAMHGATHQSEETGCGGARSCV